MCPCIPSPPLPVLIILRILITVVLCYIRMLCKLMVAKVNSLDLPESIGCRIVGNVNFGVGLQGLGLLLGVIRTLATPGVQAVIELGWPLLGPASVTVDRLFRRLTLKVPWEFNETICLASRVG